MAMSHLLASLVSPLNSSWRATLISMSSSFSLVRGSMWTEEQEESAGKESGELGGDGTVDSASRSKYCVQVRSPDGVTDHKWEPLEKVGGGQKRK